MLRAMENRMKKRPEILAPAGTYEAMEAAVKAGCDAVYAGGSLFSARAYAGNFDADSLVRAIDYCHLFGVKVYLTLNTLLKEKEIAGTGSGEEKQRPKPGEAVISFLRPYYEAGLDAVLIQDMGVYKILREAFPDLPLHASTQMSIASSYGCGFLKKLGFERIVPARELSLEEILAIKKKTDIEIETFVHGAMCFAYSGKCLFSSFAGGRSGNRGRCAQPCRQLYELFDTGTQESGPSVKEYLMSLKDLCTLKELPLLVDAGIDSFKIEGRMKNPGYVACVVSAYRRAEDGYLKLLQEEKADSFDSLSAEGKARYASLIEQDFKDLQDIYNRGGFHSGYYFTDKGKVMSALDRPNHQGLRIGTVTEVRSPKILIGLKEELHPGDVIELRGKEAGIIELTSGISGRSGETVSLNGKDLKKIKAGMEVFRTRNEALLKKIEKTILEKEPAVSADCRIRARIGEPLQILLRAEDAGKDKESISVLAEGTETERAAKAATTEKILIEKMQKSGGSGIRIRRVECDMDEGAFVPMSSFNQLRREAAEKLKEKIIDGYHRKSKK